MNGPPSSSHAVSSGRRPRPGRAVAARGHGAARIAPQFDTGQIREEPALAPQFSERRRDEFLRQRRDLRDGFARASCPEGQFDAFARAEEIG
jgi:hypothetical protein